MSNKRRQPLGPTNLLLVFAVLGGAAVYLQSVSDKIADPDSFYHVRHSLIYRDQGIFDSSFPWLTQSVVSQARADLWYGFHILTLPVCLGDPVGALHRGSVFTTMLSLLIFYFALTRLHIRWALFWTLFYLLCSPDHLYRLTMFRPHPISISLTVLAFTYYLVEATPRQRAAVAFLCTFLVTWIHLSFFWAPFLAVGVAALAARLQGGAIRFRYLAWMIGGAAIGTLLRPHPVGALHLLHVQLFQLFSARARGVAFNSGHEMDPYTWHDLAVRLFPLLVFLAAAGVYLALSLLSARESRAAAPGSRGRAGEFRWAMPGGTERTSMLAAFLLAAGFTALAFLSTRRAMDFGVAFTAVSVALASGRIWTAVRQAPGRTVPRRTIAGAAIAALVLFVFSVARSAHWYGFYMNNACQPYKFQAVASWMKANIPPRSIVFVPYWDEFPQLFFWDDQHYYIIGMDPVFQYVYNAAFYWKTFHIEADQATRLTFGTAEPDSTGQAVESYRFMKEESGAGYVLLRTFRSPRFSAYLASDPRFKKLFDNRSVVIYRIQ